jgi:diguanylate cyclase (GGDEF)-like protein
VPPGEWREVVVNFGNADPIPIHLNLRLWDAQSFERHSVAKTAFFVFWIGCLVTAAFFWLVYGLFMRQARMMVYAAYMVSVASTYVIFSGVGLQLLFPASSWIQHLGFHWSAFLLTCTAFEFARQHLDIPRLHPRHNLVLRAVIAVYAVAAVLSFPSRFPAIELPLVYLSLVLMPPYITWLSWVAWRRDGLHYASWMVLGWGCVTLSAALVFCVTAAFIPLLSMSHIVGVRLTFASMVFESLLLSASLAQWLRGQEIRRIAAEDAASRDSLTGLLNRRGFDDHVARLKRMGVWPGRLWLVLIDFDQFKRINDTFSHAAGDAVLIHFASLLRREFRSDDVTARFGGEEFILLFDAESPAVARSVAERVRQRFAETPTRYEDALIAHTMSAGLLRVADGPDDDEATLIAMADRALYAAKRAGRNCIREYSEAVDAAADGALDSESLNPDAVEMESETAAAVLRDPDGEAGRRPDAEPRPLNAPATARN